jgi:hypothetical protein
MRETTITARKLLSDAAAIYDADVELRNAARGAWRTGFHSGAMWMAMALNRCRPGEPIIFAFNANPSRFQILGIIKYAMAATAAAPCVAAAILLHSPWPILLAPIVFYLYEVQMLFLFPLALDGSPNPFRDARDLTRRAGGTLHAAGIVMVLAAVMLFGGLAGRGFVRCWCLGCLAVCIWYEAVVHLPREGGTK